MQSGGDLPTFDAFQTYEGLVIQAQINILSAVGGGDIHCAGPLYPDFEQQGRARHWRKGVPVDTCPPEPAADLVQNLDEDFTYGGCLTEHFGHWLSEFVHRVLPSVRAFPALRMLFVAKAGDAPTLPPFAQDVLAYLGLAPERIRLVHAPVRVRRLHVFAQQEHLRGPAPTAAYLEALQALQRAHWPHTAEAQGTLFVSRARQRKGLAGEAVLDRIFAAAGARVFHPEAYRVEEQLAAYQSHARLLFSEGSALHGLQLLGRVPGEVTVLARRPWRMGATFLQPRVGSLAYVQLGAGMLAYDTPAGRPAGWAGLSFIDLDRLKAFCPAYFPHWPAAEREACLREVDAELNALELASVRQFLGGLKPVLRRKQAAGLTARLRALQRFSEAQISALAAEFLSVKAAPRRLRGPAASPGAP